VDVKHVGKIHQDERTSDTWIRPRVEECVSGGHPTRLIGYCRVTRIMSFLTVVVKQQKTTVAILMRNGTKESGAIQRMSISAGKRVTSPNAVSPFYYGRTHYGMSLYFAAVVSSFFLSSSVFFFAYSQRSEIAWLPYLHTWCGFSANLECISETEMCCTGLAENRGRKIYANGLYLRN